MGSETRRNPPARSIPAWLAAMPAWSLSLLAPVPFFVLLLHDNTQWNGVFWNQLPDSIFWPVFVVATLATIVASQALISASFQIIKHVRGPSLAREPGPRPAPA